MKQRRALILYGTMTHNTEKVAQWFADTFDAYNWDVTMLRIRSRKDVEAHQEEVYFDDYDVICLGSPIVAGAPIQPIMQTFSLGGGGKLEKEVQKDIDRPGTQNDVPDKPPIGSWRRNEAPYPGVLNKTDSRPLGIVFSTYGGGFYGGSECMATLETLKLYLNTYSVDVVGFFACGGKEHGPSAYPMGVKPKAHFKPGKPDPNSPDADVCDPEVYIMKDGTKKYGSYFFHYDLGSKPGAREEAKARAFASDFIEDYFMTYDGKPNPPLSYILSIS